MHRLESLKNWGTGEDIGKERTQYELKIAFFKDLQGLRHLIRGTQREYSSKTLKHSIVNVF